MKNYTTQSLILALTPYGFHPVWSEPYVRFFLSPTEAEHLYHHPSKKPDSTFFHTPISPIQAEREIGHYLNLSSAEVFLDQKDPVRSSHRKFSL
ncbi:MAG: hypothetical protein IPO07_25385 [Haliscomenobacter sp.]|nr:hypothetical protein [Haliscomenobacter sp.]MBK9491755.1 hypothetical protein [Haliscomenobacter sp.]